VPARSLILRKDDLCAACGRDVAAGTRATWDSALRSVTCSSCTKGSRVEPSGPELLDCGIAGASAGREYDRRKANREKRIRGKHPHLGGVILALGDEPQHQRAWDRGRQGEEAVAESLESRTADGAAALLHDRRMRHGRGNIDHIAVAPSGVFVIDAKDIIGKVIVQAPLFGQPKLLVAGRDRTKLIDGLDRQVAAVKGALAGEDVPTVQGVLCFTRADLPLLGTARMRGHLLLYRKALAKRLNADGPLDTKQIEAVARRLAAELPAA
jgi:Nuclease-related domain